MGRHHIGGGPPRLAPHVRFESTGELLVKKGRHRRFEEARALKQVSLGERPVSTEPCPECSAAPGADHASWCLYTEDDSTEDDGAGAEDEDVEAGDQA
jgi:hypothetical protein